MSRTPSEALSAALEPGALAANERHDLAVTYARRSFELGLSYGAPTGPRPIPAAFPPIVEPLARTADRARLARAITTALARTARAVFDGALGEPIVAALLAELSPLERELVTAGYRDIDHLATVRVDMFVAPDGSDRVLEVNATIPAMQGYSDVATRAFVEAAIGVLGGMPPDDAAAEAERRLAPFPRNADDLLASLVAGYRAEGGAAETPSIALVHRPGDSQLGELRYLAARFRALGHEARTVEAAEIALDAAGRAIVTGGLKPDVLYRHIFASRVDPALPFASILRAPRRHHLLNPVDPHLEQKSLLAELSAAAADPERTRKVGLLPEECELVLRHVPWTRRLVPGPSHDAQGRAVPELLAHVEHAGAGLVLKRSWDFGGKGVFLGAEHGDEGSRTRTRERFGAELSWPSLVKACGDEGGWVVQERVPLASRPLLLATADGARATVAFVDVSAYTSLGTSPAPRGGVCRASGSPIVNIQSGGGVVPLVPAELLAAD